MDFNENFVRDNYIELYWNKGRSLTQISRDLKIPLSTLHGDFVKFGIRTRNKKEAQKLVWRNRKSGAKK